MFKVNEYTLCFVTNLTKGNNCCDFLFASMGNKALSKRYLSERKVFVLKEANPFLRRGTSLKIRDSRRWGRYKSGRFTSL